MVRTNSVLPALIVLSSALPVSAAGESLPGLPRPPDQPASLFAPPLAAPPGSAPAELPGPYFEHDPRLDSPALPPPGWFTALDVGYLVPHVKNSLVNQVQVGTGPPTTVIVPSAPLDWTVSPRFQVGYRLPSGFGEFIVSYRFLASHGTSTIAGNDAPAALDSRLDLNQVGLDYASREWSLGPCWDMKWRFGVRMDSIYFDSHAVESLAVAAAGSGIFAQQTSNRFIGVGPDLGLELARRFETPGLALVGRVNGWIGAGRLRQAFVAQSTNRDANGVPLAGQTVVDTSQVVPYLSLLAGLRWQPPGWQHASLFVGGQYEYWWSVGADTNQPFPYSRGELSAQGILLRAEFTF